MATTKRTVKPRRPIEVGDPVEIIKPPKTMNHGVRPIQLPSVPDGANNKYTSVALAIVAMDACDLYEPQQVQQRIVDYFQVCADNDMKPAVNGLALALGTNRQRLWEIATDNDKQIAIPAASKHYIKQAYNSLQLLWENYMQNGQVNPVSGIFLGKNHFGYRDQQEHILTPNNPLGNDVDSETIARKYDDIPD